MSSASSAVSVTKKSKIEVIGGLALVVDASAAMSQETRFPPLVNIAVPSVDWSPMASKHYSQSVATYLRKSE